MNLLVHGRFHPSIGGIETVLLLLATEWQRTGHHVVVASDVKCARPPSRRFSFEVRSRPGPRQWLRLLREADVFVHMNLSLRALWPRLFVQRPLIVIHQGFYYSDSIRGSRDWPERLKLRLLRWATNVAVSGAVASRLPVKSAVIPNPFDHATFHLDGNSLRRRNLIYVGRLVSEKGVDLLLNAVGRLKQSGLRPRLTVVGDGPERAALQRLASNLGIIDRVHFTGSCPATQVADLLRRHAILVVPTLCEEAFGVVALEGAACGCAVLGSDGGGLREAIGPAGSVFRRGDLGALTSQLANLLLHAQGPPGCPQAVAAHLERHHVAVIAEQYLSVFRKAVAPRDFRIAAAALRPCRDDNPQRACSVVGSENNPKWPI